MELLINLQTASKYVPISQGIDKNTFEVYIREAQQIDLFNLVGERFFNDLLANHLQQSWQPLLKGCIYQYNNLDYSHLGLENVIVYFAYARYLPKANIVSTSHGIVTKKTQYSAALSFKEAKKTANEYRQNAKFLFKLVKDYVVRNPDTFPNAPVEKKESFITVIN